MTLGADKGGLRGARSVAMADAWKSRRRGAVAGMGEHGKQEREPIAQ